jgi:hypothetical protein
MALGGGSGVSLPEDEAGDEAQPLSHDRETRKHLSLAIDYRESSSLPLAAWRSSDAKFYTSSGR